MTRKMGNVAAGLIFLGFAAVAVACSAGIVILRSNSALSAVTEAGYTNPTITDTIVFGAAARGCWFNQAVVFDIAATDHDGCTQTVEVCCQFLCKVTAVTPTDTPTP